MYKRLSEMQHRDDKITYGIMTYLYSDAYIVATMGCLNFDENVPWQFPHAENKTESYMT